ncbi:hypothetical protein KKD52_15070 [Myxococcota bacterium]|nr:hypothetical protein [Myxococcota bacterium]
MHAQQRITHCFWLVVLTSSFLACSGKGTGKDAGCPPVVLPRVVAGEVITPTEVDISVKLVVADAGGAFARGFWESMTLKREETGPDGARWTNDARIFTGAQVRFEPGPVLYLFMDRSTAKEPFGRPLQLHLRFDNRRLTDCKGRTGTTDLDVGFVIQADAGPLRLTGLHVGN